MSYNPVVLLKQALQRTSQGGRIDKAVILDIFRLIRLTLEARKLRTAFPKCAMYCDWLQHIELERNPGVLSLIEAIDSIFCLPQGESDCNTEIKMILDALGLVTLRHELINLFGQLSLPMTLITSQSNWYKMITVVIEDLVGKPLLLTEPQTKKLGREAVERMTARRRAAGKEEHRRVYKVVISDKRIGAPTEDPPTEDQPPEDQPPGFYYNIFLSPREPDRIQIIGLWEAQEGRDAFTHD